MIKAKLDNYLLDAIIQIEKNKEIINSIEVPLTMSNRLRKNTKKRSTYASNKIEGNPLTYEQAEQAISEKNRHLLKPEQEIRNYFLALEYLEEELKKKTPISLDFILKIQKIICDGSSKEKIGLRGAMPAGVMFAVFNNDGTPAYIPPKYNDIPKLLDELINYINNSDDHPLIKAAVIHYQMVTIHPFEDGNGRTARILSNYYLSLMGYGFKNIGALEEYMAYDIDEYYNSLQMNLPINYYEGRNSPTNPNIWFHYFIRIFELYTNKIVLTIKDELNNVESLRMNNLSKSAYKFLVYLKRNKITTFAPIDLAKKLNVSNKTIINWSVELVNNDYLKPILVNKRVRSYKVLIVN